MPLLSDTMTEGKIISWNKKVGDKVKADDVLADVETDKATMEVNGYVDGTLLYIGVPAGEAAKINQIIAIVGKEGEDYKSLLDEDASVTKPAEAKNEQPATNNEQLFFIDLAVSEIELGGEGDDILRKTWGKMSADGRAAALTMLGGATGDVAVIAARVGPSLAR